MLQRLSLQQTSRPIDVFPFWKREGHLLLSPPYQRGDVWGRLRKQNLVRSILLGIPIPSIIVNDRFYAGWGQEIAVIDGKQRITAILEFLESRFEVPGEWFGQTGSIVFEEIPPPQQRRFRHIPLQVAEGNLASLEMEIEVFELVNFGGVPQGCSDI